MSGPAPADGGSYPAAGAAYYPLVDVTRIAAALSICFLHTSGAVGERAGGLSAPELALHDLSIWALPFFLMTAGYFHAAGAPPGGRSGAWLGRRLARLALPFLAFTALYRTWEVHHFHQHYTAAVARLDLIYGTASAHLWFLPVLVECSVIVWLVERSGRRAGRLGLLAVSAGGAVTFVALSSLAAPGATYGYYLYRTPLYWLAFYTLGWALARWRNESASRDGGRRAASEAGCATSDAWSAWGLSAIWPWLGLVAGAACLIASRLPGPQQVAALYYIGAGLAGGAAAVLTVGRPGLRPGRLVRTLAAATLGFYLLHFFVLDLFLTYVPLSGWRFGTTLYEFAVYATVTVLTAAVVLVARMWRPLRWIFGQ